MTSEPIEFTQDHTEDGARTTRWVLEADDFKELETHRIARLGLDKACPPYSRVRLRPVGSFILICFSGKGRVLLDGRWQNVGAGWACMAPPRTLNAFHASGTSPWYFGWVRYDEPSSVAPLVGAGSPLRLKCEGQTLQHVFEGLQAEWNGARHPKHLHHWTEILQLELRRLARPWRQNERLHRLWEKVSSQLAEDWTLTKLAHEVHMSTEHLRRLCMHELGRSPMAQLTALRVAEAQRLLETTDDKLEVIASTLGYQSAVVFARAFKRWVGCNPSEYRVQH